MAHANREIVSCIMDHALTPVPTFRAKKRPEAIPKNLLCFSDGARRDGRRKRAAVGWTIRAIAETETDSRSASSLIFRGDIKSTTRKLPLLWAELIALEGTVLEALSFI